MNQSFVLPLVNLAEDGELRASTEDIARGYGMQHRALLQLLRRYMTQIETFGPCAFQMRVAERAQGGGAPTEYALLNERQTMLLLSLMRNTAKVVEFKVRLIAEFSVMAERLANRDLTMFEKRLRLEAKDQTSFAKAQIGSKLMLVRRAEKPAIKKEIRTLESEMNQRLFH